MTICEAIKSRTKDKPYITREEWLYDLPDYSGYPGIAIFPTNTPDNCVVCSPSAQIPHRGWQPTAEDLIAEDWIISDRY